MHTKYVFDFHFLANILCNDRKGYEKTLKSEKLRLKEYFSRGSYQRLGQYAILLNFANGV